MADNRYGRFKYGTSHKYGASSPALTTLLYGLQVDWTGTGYTGENEAKYCTRFVIERGRDGPFTTNSKGQAQLARNRVGTCSFTLDNSDRRFDPWYASGPLYPNVQPGHNFKFFVQNGSAGSRWNLITGKIDDVQNTGDRSNPRFVMSGQDGWRFLMDADAYTSNGTNGIAYWAGAYYPKVDEAITSLLTNVSWPWSSSIDAGTDNLEELWVDLIDGHKALHELCEAELGLICIAGDGTLYFKNRATLAGESPALTLTETQCLQNLVQSQPWDSIRNKILVMVNARTIDPAVTLWTNPQQITLASSASITFSAQPSGTNGQKVPAIAPTGAGVALTVNADGTGGEVTSSYSEVVRPGQITFTLTNTDSVTGYSTTPWNVTGDALNLINPQSVTANDADSQSRYGVRSLLLDNPYVQTRAHAQTLANQLVKWHEPYPILKVQIVARPTIQFAYDLGTLIHFESSYLGIDSNFRICKIRHESLNETLQAVKTTWTLEPIPT